MGLPIFGFDYPNKAVALVGLHLHRMDIVSELLMRFSVENNQTFRLDVDLFQNALTDFHLQPPSQRSPWHGRNRSFRSRCS